MDYFFQVCRANQQQIISYVKNIKKDEYVIELVYSCTLFIPGTFNELNFLFMTPTNALTDVYK